MGAVRVLGVLFAVYGVFAFLNSFGVLNNFLPEFLRSPWFWNPIAQLVAPPSSWLGLIPDVFAQMKSVAITLVWSIAWAVGGIVMVKMG
jgi:hypothetical protein